MAAIVRCPSCYTHVYADARTCHGCGERLGRRRILTRGSWVFIALAVTGYAIARGIDIEQSRRDRFIREMQAAQAHAMTTAFVRTWVEGGGDLTAYTHDSAAAAKLISIRQAYPGLFPAVVDTVTLGESTRAIRHVGSDRSGTSQTARVLLNGRHSGNTYKIPFTARFTSNGIAHTAVGSVCASEDGISCFVLDGIDSVEGPVRPQPR